ncbi:hypothetical protein [Streptomyces yunnanensis]|uniref:hypothetical protein n=1 Tax=Streptomyces yunnanensis TaxID=156453 RepID=UPI00093700BD|nr:hypothetical protein [Streptomyces yunnanensis]
MADPTVLAEVRQRLLADPSHSDAAVSATSMSLFLVQHPEARVSEMDDYPEFAARFTTTEDDAR